MEDRIKKLVEYSNLSTTVFADTIGVSRSAMVHLLTGRNQPSLDVVKKIITVFPEISVEWLMFGYGNMIRNSNPKQTNDMSIISQSDNNSQSDNVSNDVDLFSEISVPEKPKLPEDPIMNIVETTMKRSVNSAKKDKTKTSSERNISKIVIFYNDNTFEEYHKNA